MSCCEDKNKTATVIEETSCCETGVLISPVDGVDTNCDPCATIQAGCVTSCETLGNFPLFLSLVEAFNMPACAGTGNIKVSDASRFTRGTILYNENVGYLRVTAIVDETTITVLNECLECNVKQPGESVDTSNLFSIGIPTCGAVGTTGVPAGTPFLDLDFIAPDVGSCVDIKVTNVLGLNIGDIVSIAGYEYRVGAIPTTTQIQICNDGDGDTPGTAVYKDPNNDGVLDYPVIRIGGQNPCTATPVNEAPAIVACDGAGQQTGLVGTVENHVPSWNQTEEEWQLKVVDELATCVSLASCLLLDPDKEDCSGYLVDVAPDASQIQAEYDAGAPNPLRVTINGDSFCVTEIVDADTIRVTPSFDVVEVTEYEPGAVLCIAPCCDQCTADIEVMDRFSGGNGCVPEILVGTGILPYAAPTGVTGITIPVSIGVNGETGFEEGAESMWDLTYINDDCCDCRKYVEVISNYELAMDLPADVYANMELRILKTAPIQDSQSFASHMFVPGVGLTPPAATPTPENYLIPSFQTINTVKSGIFDRDFINPGEQMTFRGHLRIVVDNRSGGVANIQYLAQWRVWVKAWSFGCANVVTVPAP